MRDVSHKFTTKRTARACATLTMLPATKQAVTDGRVPKGDPLPIAKAAAVMAAKKTTEWIPYCHNIPIEFVGVEFVLHEDRIEVFVDVTSVAKTGVEMEAMTAASAAALTLYDMLKMIDDDMEIVGIRLLEKKGGKSDFPSLKGWTSAVITASDRASRGDYEDQSGKILALGLERHGSEIPSLVVVPDEVEAIKGALAAFCALGVHLVLVTGGTGLSRRDVTPEAVEPLLERRLPGVEEALRSYGQSRNPLAMLSRSLAGVIGSTLVVCLPGSPSACEEAMSALFPSLLHALEVLSEEDSV
jgi:cyclic pyranopterin phosphate synthase